MGRSAACICPPLNKPYYRHGENLWCGVVRGSRCARLHWNCLPSSAKQISSDISPSNILAIICSHHNRLQQPERLHRNHIMADSPTSSTGAQPGESPAQAKARLRRERLAAKSAASRLQQITSLQGGPPKDISEFQKDVPGTPTVNAPMSWACG